MEKFRHKTTKQAFRQPYFVATGLNVVAFGAGGYYLYSKGGAQSQVMFQQLLNSPLGRTLQSEAKRTVKRMGRR